MQPKRTLLVLVLCTLLVAACQSSLPPGPTAIPTEGPPLTPSLTVSPTLGLTPATPIASLRPVITSPAIAPTNSGPAVVAVPPTNTPAICCLTAKAGDTLGGLASRCGYDYSALQAIRDYNNMLNNNVELGKQYCMPPFTPTPTPPGYRETQIAIAAAFPTLATKGPSALATYVIKDKQGILDILIDTGVSMAELCALNPPPALNCSGCDLTTPLQPKCRPILRAGQALKIPGPPPTLTITPTLTGNETATPTPVFGLPVILSPVQNSAQSGPVQLMWMPVGLLQPDQFFLIEYDSPNLGQSYQWRTQTNSYRLPSEIQPRAGQSFVVNWRVSVARDGQNGIYVQLSPWSNIFTFSWIGK